MVTFLTKKFKGYVFVRKFNNHKSTEIHSHGYIEIAYVLQGSGMSEINGKTKPLTKGDYYIIDYNSTHSYVSDNQAFTIINCLFSPQIIDFVFNEGMSFDEAMKSFFFKISGRQINCSIADHIYKDETGEIRKLFEEMLNEYVSNEPGNTEIISYYLKMIIIKLARNLGSQKRLSDDINNIIKFINEKYDQNISLSDISSEYHYTLPYLSAKFKKETGVTFTRYLQNVRVENAASLLTGTDIPIEEIAVQSGYNDLNNFYAVFKRITNLTPNEYRKKRDSI